MGDAAPPRPTKEGHPNCFKRSNGESASTAPRPAISSLTMRPPDLTQTGAFGPAFQIPATLSRPMRPARPPPEPFQKPNKVAIPRLRPEADAASAASSTRSEKQRVSHACESCRMRKVRCSGGRPRCEHCNEHDLECVYGDGKRDRAKKELGCLQGKVNEYEDFLRHLSVSADATTQKAIEDVFSKAAQQESIGMASPMVGKRQRSDDDTGSPETSEQGGEHMVSAEVGSVGSLDTVHEDINVAGPPGAAGFFGKNSDMAWISHLKDQLTDDGDSDSPQQETEGVKSVFEHDSGTQRGPEHAQTFDALAAAEDKPAVHGGDEPHPSHWTYNLDDFELESPGTLNKLDLPPRDIADQMVNAYFTTVHPSYPLLLKTFFVATYNRCYRPYNKPISDQGRALVNLVLAIGAKFLASTAHGVYDERDHLALFCRGRALSLENSATWHLADLLQTQVAALATIYLISVGHINRAWFMSGLAIRYAQGLGLHLRTHSKQSTDVQIEARVRTWWSLYSIERLLGVMTGRPSSIHEQDVSTPLPYPVEEDRFPSDDGSLYAAKSEPSPLGRGRSNRTTPSPNSSGQTYNPSGKLALRSTHIRSTLSSPSPHKANKPSNPSSEAMLTPNSATYFICRTRINIMIHHILNDLYSAATVQNTWAEVQNFITENEIEINQWLDELPHAFNCTKPDQDPSKFLHERIGLGMLYWSSRILLNRPCLCQFDDKIHHESDKSKEFHRRAAGVCVDSARNLLSLLPADHDPVAFYHLCPWWAIPHYLVQSVVIIIIELRVSVTHVPEDREGMLHDVQKVLRWLFSMARTDPAAHRAVRSVDKLFRLIEPRADQLISQSVEDVRRGLASSAVIKSAEDQPGASSQLVDGINPLSDPHFWSYGLDPSDMVPAGLEDFHNPFMFSLFDQDSTFPHQPGSMFPSDAHMNVLSEDPAENDPSHDAQGPQQPR